MSRLSVGAALLLILTVLLSSCQSEPESDGGGEVVPTSWQEPDWSSVNDWLYQLQRERPDRIGDTQFDLLVVSVGIAGGDPAVIEALKHSPGGEKIVLCYLSIGQAERYRYYWEPDWDENPPSWLDEPDPDWTDDFWVRYWEPGWQAIIFGTPDSYLDQIIALGFDGIYLDRVDAYEYYAEQGRATAAQEMVDFILAMTAYARERRPGFGVFPQNAEELGVMFPEYLDAMTGIGIEDLYYGYPRDHTASPAGWTAAREADLHQWVAAGKLVLNVDYTSRPAQIADAYQRARANGFVPYVADRSLGRLRINAGFEPD